MAKKGKTIGDAYVNLIPSAEDFSSKVEKAVSEGTEAGGKKASAGLSNLASGFAMGIGQAAFGAVEALGSKVVDIGKSAINSYKDYEQLIGGTETLFGTAAKYVEDYANVAYKSAGLSTNEYLETVNGMAAALNQSTGSIWESAKLGNQAVIDMADNANKMGTSMEMIQNAYNGFSKQNYTMLDNLKLGYGGTKQEMKRLLDDATALSGIEFDINSYADIVNAIHIIQEEMGIAGTTQLEATETIEGSLNMVKSSWDNLIAGLGKDDANLDRLIDQLLNSIFGTDKEKGFLDNLLPRVETIVSGLDKFAVELTSRLPGVVAELLPQLSTMLLNMVTNSINSLNDNLDGMIASFETIIENVVNTAITLVTSIIQMMPSIIEMAITIIVTLAKGLAENIPELVPTIIEIVEEIIDVIIDNLPMIIDAASEIINALTEGIIDSLPDISLAINKINYQIIATFLSLIPQLIELAAEFVWTLLGSMASAIMEMLSADFWNQALDDITHSFLDIDWAGIGMECLEGIAQGFEKNFVKVKDSITSIAQGIKGIFTGELEIHSPSKIFEEYGQMIDEGLAIGISSGVSIDATEEMADDVSTNFNPSLAGAGGDVVIPVYIGNELIQTIVVDALSMANYRSGGR
ncbi:MAG: hypothetical protein J5725_00805 [Bacteroidales bacterium]|nr:hypothetical protein [Bacteroidales bacterium]